MIYAMLIAVATCSDVSLYVSTPPDVCEEMLKLAEVTSSDTVFDLGCGAGRIVVTAAVRYKCRAVGIEIDRKLCGYARRNAKTNGVSDLVTIRQGDVLAADYSDATVVCIYLMPSLLEKLKPRLARLRVGTRVVSHDKPVPVWKPVKTKTVRSGEREHTLYLYRIVKPKAVCRSGRCASCR